MDGGIEQNPAYGTAQALDASLVSGIVLWALQLVGVLVGPQQPGRLWNPDRGLADWSCQRLRFLPLFMRRRGRGCGLRVGWGEVCGSGLSRRLYGAGLRSQQGVAFTYLHGPDPKLMSVSGCHQVLARNVPFGPCLDDPLSSR
jgi:hypothetical protein